VLRRRCFLPNFPVNMLPMYVPPPPIVANAAFTRSAVSASAVLSRRHHSGGGSRADHTPTRKVITVSLQQAVQLHTAENAWKPTTLKPSAADESTDADDVANQVRLLSDSDIHSASALTIVFSIHCRCFCGRMVKVLYDYFVVTDSTWLTLVRFSSVGCTPTSVTEYSVQQDHNSGTQCCRTFQC